MELGERVSAVNSLRQGDILDLDWIPEINGGELIQRKLSAGVAIISQTCDVVQESESKRNMIVAPIVEEPDRTLLSNARRGRSPLKLFLEGCGTGGSDVVVDLQFAASVPKSFVKGTKLLGRRSVSDHSQEARDLSMAIARAFSRFAFPDAVQVSLSKFLKKTRDKAGSIGPLGRTLDYVDSLRVSADHWDGSGRNLKVYVIVPAEFLIFPEDADPNWSWQSARADLDIGSEFNDSNLNQVSEKLADYCEQAADEAQTIDQTTLLRLWELWTEKLQEELLDPSVDEEVSTFEVELLSDEEFTFANWKRTESLDLEDLSNSQMPIED